MELKTVSVNDIARNPWNPHFADNDELDRILNSIKTFGMVDPVTVVEWDRPVRWLGKEQEPTTKYLLVDGEQRYTAISKGVKRKELPDQVLVLVLGKLSEFDEVELAELGERLNHARGTGERADMTGHIAKAIMERKKVSLDELAKLLGKPKPFLEEAIKVTDTRYKMVPVRPQVNSERDDVEFRLIFPNEDAYEEFNELVGKVLSMLQDEGCELPETRRYRRTFAITEALRRFVEFGQ
jgi:ParB-like chromosome segregation protein Spo0J